jgi:hypothetical protein
MSVAGVTVLWVIECSYHFDHCLLLVRS